MLNAVAKSADRCRILLVSSPKGGSGNPSSVGIFW